MNLLHIINLALKKMQARKKSTFYICLISIISFILISLSVFCSSIMIYINGVLNHAFYGNLDHIYMMQIFGSDAEERVEFQEAVLALEEICAVGSYREQQFQLSQLQSDTPQYLERLKEMADKREGQRNPYSESMLDSVVMSYAASGLLRFQLIDGEPPCYEEEIDRNRAYIYLGYAYREIPIGTEFYVEDYDIGRYTYEVAGIYDKGAYVFNYMTLSAFRVVGEYKECLDDQIVLILPELSVGNSRKLYCINEGYDIETTREKVRELAKMYHQDSYIDMPLENHKEGLFYLFNALQKNANYMMLLTCMVAIIIFTCIQLLDIMAHLEEYGIWIANGITKRDIIHMLLIENVIKICGAYLLSVAMMEGVFHTILSRMKMILEIREVFELYAFPFTFGVSILMVFIASFLPILFVAKLPNCQIVKGDWRST